MKKFAISDCVYAPGLICIDSDGIVTYDPKSSGSESVICIKSAMGYEVIGFEDLIGQLLKAGTPFRTPELPTFDSLIDAYQAEQYSKHCINLAKQISEKILS